MSIQAIFRGCRVSGERNGDQNVILETGQLYEMAKHFVRDEYRRDHVNDILLGGGISVYMVFSFLAVKPLLWRYSVKL